AEIRSHITIYMFFFFYKKKPENNMHDHETPPRKKGSPPPSRSRLDARPPLGLRCVVPLPRGAHDTHACRGVGDLRGADRRLRLRATCRADRGSDQPGAEVSAEGALRTRAPGQPCVGR